ncbi:chromo domain-containing protein [Apiospora sp. TS-2023a]
MSTFLSTVKGFMSPSKPTPANGNSHLNNEDKMSRGLKRKADPYDVVDGEVLTNATQTDEAPQPSSSKSHQRVRSRVSMDAPPPSSAKARQSAGKIKRRSRSMGKPAEVELASSPSKATASQSTLAQTNGDIAEEDKTKASKAPVADMGGEELLQNIGDAPDSSDKPDDNDADHMIQSALEKREFAETQEDGETEIDKLLKHRRLSDGSVEILVKWVDEAEEDATYEPEEEIQRGAAETLYDYWKSQGDRTTALFYKGKNPPPETYHVFKILRHEKKKTIFQFEVQWVGYPATPTNTSMEPETKLKKICPELLEEYWASKGGREGHLARRGRAKKARND